MKSFILYVALAVVFADFINAKSLKTKIFRERRYVPRPPPRHGGVPPQRFPLGLGTPRPGQMRPPMQGQMRPPMQGQMGPQMPGGQMPGTMGQQQMGGPGCGGCAQAQGPKMCPAICMRWNTIIKPNGQIENGPSSITPLAPNERVGANGVFPAMNQMMGGPMQQPGMMRPGMMQRQPYQQPYPQQGFGGAQPPRVTPAAIGTPRPTQG